MDLGLTGSRVLITGASKGIGLATAKAMAAEGCHVAIAARDEATLSGAVADIQKVAPGAQVRAFSADLSKPADRARLIAECSDVDILVNNAGANPRGEIDEIDDDQWRAAWDLKLFGYINMTRALYKAMKARGSGVIINVIGNSGERMEAQYILGSTGNIALMGLSRALGGRSPDFGIRVLAVNPGYTMTERGERMMRFMSERDYGTPDLWEKSLGTMNFPFGRMATPEEVANVITFMASPRAAYVSGTVVTVDGGAANRVP